MRFRRRPRNWRGIAPLLPEGTSLSPEEYEDWRDLHTWDPGRDSDLSIEHDLTAADWIGPLLAHGSFTVSMTAPRGYEAYARIFFPFERTGLDPDGRWWREQIRWTDLARANGWVAHPLMERETITCTAPAPAEPERCSWSLSPEQQHTLLGVLARHTTSTMGWFLLWDGFGNLSERAFGPRVPRLVHPMRNYYLLRGPLGSYRQFPDDPSYWWPDDRAWCLSTDTDFSWSYLAGSRECVDEVLQTPVADAMETVPDNPARSGMDTVNDPHGRVPRSP